MATLGYKLRIDGGAYTNFEIDVGLVLEYTFTGLAPSTEYSVEVASYDDSTPTLQSPWSAKVYETTDDAPELMMVVDGSGDVITDEEGAAATILI